MAILCRIIAVFELFLCANAVQICCIAFYFIDLQQVIDYVNFLL